MGFIHKIKKNSITILPVTVADAVIMNDKDNGNLTEHLKKLGDDVDTLKSWFDVDEAGNIHTKDNRGFYSESFVSAGGKSTTEGGGGGGANLTQIWESLQGNNDTFKDRLINVAHIPTLTTGKISDFVSATQAIADNAVTNKADKDKVVDLASNQTITGEKTFSKLKVSNTNLVTNLNANMVGGYISSVLFTCESGYGVDVNAPHRNKKSGPLLYRISSNCTNIPPLCTNGVLVHFNSQGTDTAFQLVSNYGNTGLYYRSGNLNESGSSYLYNRAWKQLAFTNQLDNYLPITGGTLTGDVILNYKSNNFTPSLIFQRKYADDNYIDWRIRAGADGKLEFGYNYIADSTGIAGEWVTPITLSTTVVSINTTINSGAGFTGVMKFLNASEVSATGFAVGNAAKSTGSHSLALGYGSMATHASSKVIAEGGLSGRNYQTVLGYYNDEDTDSALVVGWGAGSSARKNIFTIGRNGEVGFGAAGRARTLLVSPTSNQIYINKKNDDGTNYIPFLVDTDTKSVSRGSSGGYTTLGTDQYKWFNVFTEALKIADANLTYDIGTLTVDKALTVASTLTATQGVFSNYIKIGNATISWNPKGYLEINEGLASHKFISAGGVVTGDAGGGGGGLSLTDMWVSLNGNIDAYGKSKIHIDHIPLDVILSHDSYENDVANRINTFNYSNSSSFTSAVKALIVADNIPTLEMSKIEGLETTLTNIGTVVQNNYDNLNESISTLQKGTIADHEARIKAIEQALTWQTV